MMVEIRDKYHLSLASEITFEQTVIEPRPILADHNLRRTHPAFIQLGGA